MALEAVRRLKRRRPDLHVDLLTRPPYRDLARLCPDVRRVVGPAGDEENPAYGVLWDLQGGRKGRRLARGYRAQSRVAAPSESFIRRAHVLAGGRLFRPRHQLARFLEPACGRTPGAGPVAGPALLAVGPAPRAADPVRVGLAPLARRSMKAWPLPRYLDLSARLAAQGMEPVWFWDPARPLPEELAGQTCVAAPLAEAAGQMATCRVVVAGDTGLAHLASAVGCHAVVLFGSTVPGLGHTPAGPHTVLDVDLPCRPCHVHGASSCWLGHRRCLTEITTDRVVRAVRDALIPSQGEEREEEERRERALE
jgi:heptosyltransferase-2